MIKIIIVVAVELLIFRSDVHSMIYFFIANERLHEMNKHHLNLLRLALSRT